MKDFVFVDGGVAAPKGFRACGVHAGIKKERPDLAMIVSDEPAAVAGVFTLNRIQAAPVKACRDRLRGGRAQVIVVNSGNANACTGQAGREDAEEMARCAAQALGIDARHVFPCSTGTIGVKMPMDKIRAGIPAAVEALSAGGGDAAARAIMTTDTVPKQTCIEVPVGGCKVRIGGMAKGAGMIHPNMATMLAFLTTDASVAPAALQACLSRAVDVTFNCISIDGDQSTNDTVLFLANGEAGNRELSESDAGWPGFAAAVEEVCRHLAMKIVEDGEGATRVVTVRVAGARSVEDAALAANAVARSALVKTSWYGGDPNWGRVIDAVGYSGADVEEDRVEIRYDEVCAVRGGMRAEETSLADLESVLRRKRFAVCIDLHLGGGERTVYTCDLSEEYVRINSEYMT